MTESTPDIAAIRAAGIKADWDRRVAEYAEQAKARRRSGPRQNKRRHCRLLATAVVEHDHRGRRLGVRVRRPGLRGRQWVKLRKAIRREIRAREAKAAA